MLCFGGGGRPPGHAPIRWRWPMDDDAGFPASRNSMKGASQAQPGQIPSCC